VVEDYFIEFTTFVSARGSSEEFKKSLEGVARGSIDWATYLDIAPLWDFWNVLEQAVYTECLHREENKEMDDYLERRERVRREV
jgi:hypothetical protein